jgi:uncharacterized membrane protein
VTTIPEPTVPTPEDVKAWNEVVPGGAQRLFDEYIRQLHHRQRMETANMTLAFFGPVLGFVVVLAFLGTAAWLIYKGFSVEGTVLGTVDITSLAAVFVLGGQMQDKKQDKK